MILLKFALCNSKNSIFIKEQGASGFLSNLEFWTPFSKFPLLGDIVLK